MGEGGGFGLAFSSLTSNVCPPKNYSLGKVFLSKQFEICRTQAYGSSHKKDMFDSFTNEPLSLTHTFNIKMNVCFYLCSKVSPRVR